jgi:hypothetical protein
VTRAIREYTGECFNAGGARYSTLAAAFPLALPAQATSSISTGKLDVHSTQISGGADCPPNIAKVACSTAAMSDIGVTKALS